MKMLGDTFVPEPEGEARVRVTSLAFELMAFAKSQGYTPVECAQACFYIQQAMTFAVLKQTTDGILERTDNADYTKVPK